MAEPPAAEPGAPIELPFATESEGETGKVALKCKLGVKKSKHGTIYVTTCRIIFWPDLDTRVARGSEKSHTVKKDVRILPSRVTDIGYSKGDKFMVKVRENDPRVLPVLFGLFSRDSWGNRGSFCR